jgi:precorrin-2 dehydrogenase/sirohydrochlorin ferrochelatase
MESLVAVRPIKPLMRYYPVFLDIAAKSCIVVGGGRVAERKAAGLLAAGAVVTIISPRVTRGIAALKGKGRLKLLKRAYKRGDLNGAALVVSAASGRAVNRAVHADAVRAGLPVNVVDDPALCTFIVPSVVDRSPLLLAISTSGAAPAFSRRLRETLEDTIGPEYAVFVELIGRIRNKLLNDGVNSAKKKRVVKALAASPVPAWLAANSTRKVNTFLGKLIGEGYTLKDLGIKLSRKDAPGRNH